MSCVGGAGSWYSRRGAPDSESEDASSYESADEEVFSAVQRCGVGNELPFSADQRCDAGDVPLCEPLELPLQCNSSIAGLPEHRVPPTLASKELYEAALEIYTPSNEVKKRTGQLLLSSRGAGQYNLYKHIDLDGALLDHAGHLPASALATDRKQFADRVTESACRSRCGAMCSNACRVRAYVDAGEFGTDFYFGAREDIELALLTCGAACDVYIWDELEHRTMAKLNKHLDNLIETWPGLAMRVTELRTVPGQVCALLVNSSANSLACFQSLSAHGTYARSGCPGAASLRH